MRAGYQQKEASGAAIVLHLLFCMSVFGLFAFGFYSMFSARYIPNNGLAAYSPPPATVINYPSIARAPYGERVRVEASVETNMPDETTGRAVERPLTPAPIAPEPVPEVKSNVAAGAVTRHAAQRPRKAPETHVSRAERRNWATSQPNAYGLATFPGYASVQ
jgi:hypothetical protein